MQLIITKHAQYKMSGLGITIENIKKAIIFGSKTQQTEGLLSYYSYYCVAYRIIGKNTYKIKTVYIR